MYSLKPGILQLAEDLRMRGIGQIDDEQRIGDVPGHDVGFVAHVARGVELLAGRNGPGVTEQR